MLIDIPNAPRDFNILERADGLTKACGFINKK